MEKVFIEKIAKFIEKYPEQKMRTSLIQIFIDFIRYQDQQSAMPTNTYTLLNDIEAMFELLSIVENYNKVKG